MRQKTLTLAQIRTLTTSFSLSACTPISALARLPKTGKVALVDRGAPVAIGHRSVDTYTEAEVTMLLASIAEDRLGHAWELALCGLRRGEIAGLRWADVDLDAKTLSVANNRVTPAARRRRTTRSRPCRVARFRYQTGSSSC